MASQAEQGSADGPNSWEKAQKKFSKYVPGLRPRPPVSLALSELPMLWVFFPAGWLEFLVPTGFVPALLLFCLFSLGILPTRLVPSDPASTRHALLKRCLSASLIALSRETIRLEASGANGISSSCPTDVNL